MSVWRARWRILLRLRRAWESFQSGLSCILRHSFTRIFHGSTLLYSPAAAVVAGLKLSPSPVGLSGDRVRVIYVFLFTSLTETLLSRLFSSFRHPAVRRVLVDPNLFHMIIMGTAELLETINGADSFSSLVQICLAPAQSLSSSANSFELIDLIPTSCKALLRVVCALKMWSCPFNLTQKDLDEDVESSQNKSNRRHLKDECESKFGDIS